MPPRKTRRLLVVTPSVFEPIIIAVFGVRPDGQLEESSIRHPGADQIRTMLTTGWGGKPTTRKVWEERFRYMTERTPWHATCEEFNVPEWVTPSLFHALFYLLDTVPTCGQAELYAESLEAFSSSGSAYVHTVKSFESDIPIDPERGVVPATAAAMRAFRYLTGELSQQKLQELERLDLKPPPEAE